MILVDSVNDLWFYSPVEEVKLKVNVPIMTDKVLWDSIDKNVFILY